VVVETIILGVIANVTTQVFGKGYEVFSRAIQRDRELIQLIDSFIKDGNLKEYGETAKIEAFIRSPEVENVVGQIFSAEVIGKSREKNVEMIKLEFKSLFKLHVGSDSTLEKISDVIFEALINITVKIYYEKIKSGSIYYHEKLDQIRHQILVIP